MEESLVPAAGEELDSSEAGVEPVLSTSQLPEKDKSLENRLARRLKNVEKERDALAAAQEAAKQATLTESERWKVERDKAVSERDALSAKLTQRTLQHKFEAAAAKLGAVDVDAAYKLADLSGVEIDDDGNVTGIEAALADLKKSRKFLFGSPSVGSPGGNPANGAPGQISPQQLKSLTAAEIKAAIESGRIKI